MVESMAAGVGDDEESEVAAALREALRQQARTVEELRAELEEERRAAASGADEALAMILRLQAERATERMEAAQFRRVAEERIRHDEDTLAFLKAVVFHQEMEISSLNRRLLAVVHGDDPFSPAAAVDLPWLRKLASKNGVMQARRNASLPAASIEELCSGLDVADKSYACKDRRPARTVSDIGEVIGREKDWTGASHQPLPPPPRLLHRSASHRTRSSPSYSAQCGMRSARASPEIIIAEEDEKTCNKINTNPALEADVEQIKATVQSLQTELTKLRESTVSVGDAQSRLLTEIHAKLDCCTVPQKQTVRQGAPAGSSRESAELTKLRESTVSVGDAQSRLLTEIHAKLDCCTVPQKQTVRQGAPAGSSSPVQVKRAIREEGSSSSSMVPALQGELLMNHFIEVCGLTFSALLVRPLLKVAASMSLLRCFLILALAVAIRKVLTSS